MFLAREGAMLKQQAHAAKGAAPSIRCGPHKPSLLHCPRASPLFPTTSRSSSTRCHASPGSSLQERQRIERESNGAGPSSPSASRGSVDVEVVQADPTGSQAGASIQGQGQQQENFPVNEVLRLMKLAFPILLQYITANVTYLVNTGYVGHLSKPELLSGLVLAASLSTATGYNIMSGISTATETVCGQAYGARNFRALNETLQRALLICAVVCVPISFLWSNAEPILLQLGQPESIAVGAAQYLQIVTPALLLYSIHDCIDRYLVSQGVVRPSLTVASICSLASPLISWYFISNQNLGLPGAGYAYLSVQLLNAALSAGYIVYREQVDLPRNPPEGYQPLRPSIRALENWGPYIALAIPAIISYCMEGWACEVLIFFAGTLDNAELAVGVTGITLQFSTFVWLVAASFASATSFTVGNKLGAGDAQGAKKTAFTAIGSVLATQSVIGVTAYHFKDPLLGLLSSNKEIVELALGVMPTLAWCFVADGLTAVQGGVLRGAGRQWWAAGLNLLGWWGVGVPLAYYLSHPLNMNVTGLWAGFATASVVQTVLQFGVINKLDWDNEVKRSDALVANSSKGE